MGADVYQHGLGVHLACLAPYWIALPLTGFHLACLDPYWISPCLPLTGLPCPLLDFPLMDCLAPYWISP